jgi:hypothetical protein
MDRSVEKQAADREKETEKDYWRYISKESVENTTADGEMNKLHKSDCWRQ